MGQDKKQLTQLLSFVKALYNNPDNKEFAAGIDSIVINGLAESTNEELKKIREAIELRADASIDYSFVEDPFVQRQLFIDNLRMENALLDLSMSEIDRYESFCVSAFLQVENLLNYYYCTKFDKDLDVILDELEFVTKEDKFPFIRIPKKTYQYVSEIPISSKIQAYCDQYFPFDASNKDFTTKNLHALRNIRNDIFHRAGEKGNSTKPSNSEKPSVNPTAATFRDTVKKLVLSIKDNLA